LIELSRMTGMPNTDKLVPKPLYSSCKSPTLVTTRSPEPGLANVLPAMATINVVATIKKPVRFAKTLFIENSFILSFAI